MSSHSPAHPQQSLVDARVAAGLGLSTRPRYDSPYLCSAHSTTGQPGLSVDVLRIQMADARPSQYVRRLRAQRCGEESDKVKDDPELMDAGGGMTRKMLKFRPVPADPTTSVCIH